MRIAGEVRGDRPKPTPPEADVAAATGDVNLWGGMKRRGRSAAQALVPDYGNDRCQGAKNRAPKMAA